jgi:hypothetical protein
MDLGIFLDVFGGLIISTDLDELALTFEDFFDFGLALGLGDGDLDLLICAIVFNLLTFFTIGVALLSTLTLFSFFGGSTDRDDEARRSFF